MPWSRRGCAERIRHRRSQPLQYAGHRPLQNFYAWSRPWNAGILPAPGGGVGTNSAWFAAGPTVGAPAFQPGPGEPRNGEAGSFCRALALEPDLETNKGDFQLNSSISKNSAYKLKKFALEQRNSTCSRLADEKCGKDGVKDCACGSTIKPNRSMLKALDEFGRQRLSKHYFMRDFLYSEVAEVHGIANVPDDAELAINAGKAICRNLLEPLQRVFGHITIRSAFRSANVNGFCNCHKMDCSSNKASYANHIWDHKDGDGFMGATVCIVIPTFADWIIEKAGRDWQVLAWFIHDHLPYSEMVFLVQNAAVRSRCRPPRVSAWGSRVAMS